MKQQKIIQREDVVAVHELELHPEEVREKTDTYSSLTELYGVDIFTKNFKIRKNELMQADNEEAEEIEKQLFKVWNGEIGIREDELTAYLFKAQKEEVYLPSYQTENQTWGIAEGIMIAVPIAIVIAIYILFFIDKKRR